MERYLCSHLVRVVTADGTIQANLEEIRQDGAVLECEEAIAPDAAVLIVAEGFSAKGTVTRSDSHEFGCLVEIAFPENNLWSPERWMPDHAINPERLPLT